MWLRSDPMDERQEDIGGLLISYAALNNGRLPLLMLHGVTRRWQTFLPVMQLLSLRWNVHAMDFRGHGRSGRVPGPYRVVDYVPDVVGFVRKRFDQPVVLYGHSLGAMVAAAAAAELRDSVSAVIMEDPPMQTMGSGIRDHMLHSFFDGLSRFAASDDAVPAVAAKLASLPLFNPKTGQTVRLGDTRDAASLRFTAASVKMMDEGVFSSIVAGQWLAGFDTEHIFSRLNCPALLLQADVQSGGMLTDSDAAFIGHCADDVTHVRLSGVGHIIHWERTQQLVNLLHGFLESR